MSLKASAFMGLSLDGFIARTDGAIDWLDTWNDQIPKDEDAGYHDFIKTVDLIVMGRNSFEKVLTFGFWPYEKTPVHVLSSRSLDIPDNLKGKVTTSAQSVVELHDTLAQQGIKHIYVDGGITVQKFIYAGLLNEITITRLPILLGEGIPLFGKVPKDVMLKHISTIAYDFGFVQSKYAVLNE